MAGLGRAVGLMAGLTVRLTVGEIVGLTERRRANVSAAMIAQLISQRQ